MRENSVSTEVADLFCLYLAQELSERRALGQRLTLHNGEIFEIGLVRGCEAAGTVVTGKGGSQDCLQHFRGGNHFRRSVSKS